MSENNDAQSFATAGSGKSEAEVAFELLNKLKGQGVWGERNVTAILDMYAECLDAAKGLRMYEGQNRIDAPIKQGPTITATQPMVQPQIAAQPAAPQPPQSPQPAQTHAVHAQQQHLQQAYKQG